MRAFMYWEDGKKWLRIIPESGYEWDEPMTGWVLIFDLINGGPSVFRHTDGRTIMEM